MIANQMSLKEHRQMMKQLKRQNKSLLGTAENKYKNEKVVVPVGDGLVREFDSKFEAQRYQELAYLEKANVITNLRCQVKYALIPSQKRPDGTTERAVNYIADFVYSDGKNVIVEDTKGVKTPEYVIKRKLMLQKYGIAVKEIEREIF